MLPTDIQSPGELLGAALAVEREATRHYAEMAVRMRNYGSEQAEALFERLAEEGHEREKKIVEYAELQEIEICEFTAPVTWEDPLMRTTYDAEARDPYRSTPYKALAFAAHNADRAFHMYSYISATTDDPQIEEIATLLAGDALNRSRLLQSRRRRAYRIENRGDRERQRDMAMELKTLHELIAVATGIESRLVELLETVAEHHEDLAPVAEQSKEVHAEYHGKLFEAGIPPVKTGEPIDTSNVGQDVHQDVLMLFTESEWAFNFYDIVMSHAFDEDIMLEAQRLSEAALARMELIREVQRKF